MCINILQFTLGMVLLYYGADFLITGSQTVASKFKISPIVVGITLVAFGTSLPELAACVAGVLKKEHDLAIGNIVGSNLFNILAVLALPALIAPGEVDAAASTRDFYMVMATSSALGLLILLSGSARALKPWHGGVLLLTFISYQLVLFLA